MKSLFVVLMMGLSIAQTVNAGQHYGYLNESQTRGTYFVGVNTNYLRTSADHDPLSILIPENWFSKAQINQIDTCMKNREQYVPVVTVEYIPTQVPTGIPGSTTTVRAPKITAIACEFKPGFIYTWRELVRKSSFR